MNRRDLLATAGAVGAAGLAGCASVLGSGGGCLPPQTNDLTALFPEDGDTFTRSTEPGIDHDPEEGEIAALSKYADTEGRTYYFLIRRYESPAAAETAVAEMEPSLLTATGTVTVGTYLFLVLSMSGDRSGIGALLARSPALSEACVHHQLTFLEPTDG